MDWEWATSTPSESLLICKDLSGKEITGTLDSMEGDWNMQFPGLHTVALARIFVPGGAEASFLGQGAEY